MYLKFCRCLSSLILTTPCYSVFCHVFFTCNCHTPLLIGVVLLMHSAPLSWYKLCIRQGAHIPFRVSSSHCQIQVTLCGVLSCKDVYFYSHPYRCVCNTLCYLSTVWCAGIWQWNIFVLSWVVVIVSSQGNAIHRFSRGVENWYPNISVVLWEGNKR